MKQKPTSLRFPESIRKQIVKDYGCFSKGIYALTYKEYKPLWDQYFGEKLTGKSQKRKKKSALQI